MAFRAAWLAMVVVVGACNYPLPYRQACDADANPDCCPEGSHQVIDPPVLYLCVADDMADAGADACGDAGTDAH
jgi:hypothetical protein